jgi:hypothetical protein
MDMANFSTRIRKLEAQLTVRTGLAPGSNDWFAFWAARIERLVAGEAPERIGRIPLDVIAQMREQPCSGGTAIAGVLMD